VLKVNENIVRPDPDELLTRIQAEEKEKNRGKLKIFLGYVAGVGKTYSMLEAAHQRKAEGIDVVVGFVETHGRDETEAMLAGLELIQRKKLEYHGVIVEEMDVDAVLARRPQLALVDELAHTNLSGSRHPKRYQDVEDLLEAGINVYTTLNIQHLESLNDVVAQITGITVRETVPDGIIDEASEIELIDLPPDELIDRLNEGKVYVPDQAARAIQKFFRKGNLTALRELTMRRAAARVDEHMLDYMQTRAIPGPWPATERILVCVSANPLGEKLVRSGRRLADELKAEWQAIYVETPRHASLSQGQRDQVAHNLQLAEELGAKTLTLPGQTVAGEVLEYARKHNITKIIAGKPLRPRWKELLYGSDVEQIIRHSGKIDVYVVSSNVETTSHPDDSAFRPHRPWSRYAWSLVLVLLATLLSSLIDPYITPTNLVMIYLLAVVVVAVYLGRGPSILASVLGVMAFDFFYVPPNNTLAVSDTQYLLTFAGLLVVSIVISQLTVQVREQADTARQREADTMALYALSRDLAAAGSLETIIRTIVDNISQTFGRDVVIFLPEPGPNGLIKPVTQNLHYTPNENETAVASWAYLHGQPAGRGTDTLSASEARYIPLKTAQGTIGVLGVKAIDPKNQLSPNLRRLLEAFASQSALAIERAQLTEQARQAQVLKATEKLQNALLNSISHDLRTPLVSITGVLSSLNDVKVWQDDSNRTKLIETARQEADRLNRLVANLLNMSRLEAGAVKVRLEPCDIQDVIGAALAQLDEHLGKRPVNVTLPEELPLVPVDFILIEHVLVNILDNAIKYSPPDKSIDISARISNAFLEIDVADRGIGIPPEDLSRVFDKFYRVHRPDNVSGTGLGLSICKGIIEAHNGFIGAENRPGGGAIITIGIPLGIKNNPPGVF
jgi:two-component system sensor histidine kinase KdpD